jgi:hypothetical protein
MKIVCDRMNAFWDASTSADVIDLDEGRTSNV